MGLTLPYSCVFLPQVPAHSPQEADRVGDGDVWGGRGHPSQTEVSVINPVQPIVNT